MSNEHKLKKKLILLMIVILINMVLVDSAIVLNTERPLIDRFHYKFQNSRFEFDFKFDRDSVNLKFNQYFGLVIQSSPTATFKNKDNQPIFNCSLKDRFNISYKMDPYTDVKAELDNNNSNVNNNIIYCKFVDNVRTSLENEKFYTLSFIFNSGFDSNLLNFNTFFTTTSNNSNQIILEKTNGIGLMSIYDTYKIPNAKILLIESSKITNTNCENNSNCSEIYPYNSFTLEFNLDVTKLLLTKNSCIIIINFATESIDTSNISAKMTIDNREITIDLDRIDNTKFSINGLNENLNFKSKVKLIFNGLKALDKNIGKADTFELFVYWKNSYSVLSYDSTNILNVNFVKITSNNGFLGINHIEYSDIIENAAWPIKFNFRLNSNLNDVGYILIQQTNTQENVNKANFIASTCDFSDNENISTVIGSSPICYPLNTSIISKNYKSNDEYLGSGIFFKVSNLKKDVNYNVMVWIYADSCGKVKSIGDTPDPTQQDNKLSIGEFKFKYTIFKSLNQSKLNEDIFLNQNIFAESQIISMNSKCYGSIIEKPNLGFKELYSLITKYPESDKSKKNEILMFKEIFDFNIGNSHSIDETCKDCFLFNILNKPFPKKYIFSSISEDQLNPDSNFLMQINFKTLENEKAAFLPLPLYKDDDLSYYYLNGKLEVQFSSKWYVPSNEIGSCYLSWAINGLGIQKSLQPFMNFEGFEEDHTRNYIKSNKCGTGTLDSLNSNIFDLSKNNPYINPTIKPNPMRIVSSYNNLLTKQSINQNNWTFLRDILVEDNPDNLFPNLKNYSFYLYSNCLKYSKFNELKIKSIFTFFETQIKWLSQITNSSEYVPTRVIRMIKLLPELGIFNNNSKFYELDADPVKFHYAYGENNYNTGVCLIEVSGMSLSMLIENSTTIILFLNQIILLDNDRESNIPEYPVAPLIDNTKSYGYNSSITMSTNNYYTKKSENNISLLEFMISNTEKTNYSNYHIILGSMIILDFIIGVNSTSTDLIQQNLLIPIICPIRSVSNPHTNLVANNLNSVMIASNSINRKNLGDIKVFDRILSDNTALLRINHFKKEKNDLNIKKLMATIRFKSYSRENVSTDSMYIFNGTNNIIGENINCSGYSLFVSEDVKFSIEKPYFIHTNQSTKSMFYPNFKMLENSVYIFGKKFKGVFLYAEKQNHVINSSNTSQDLSISNYQLEFKGIERPLNFKAINDNALNDLIAFNCASNLVNNNSILTNYMYSTSIINSVEILNFYSFILDYTPNNSDWSIQINKLPQNTIYLNDTEANLVLNIELPINVESNSSIIIGANNNIISNFTQDTNCFISHISTFNDVECTFFKNNFNFNNFKCPLRDYINNVDDNEYNKFDICCYSVKMDGTNPKFTVSDIGIENSYNGTFNNILLKSISFPPTTVTIGSTVIYKYFKDFTIDNQFEFNKQALLKRIIYSHSNQHQAFGIAIFELEIPRYLQKGMIVEIRGDFTPLSINGIDSLCTVIKKSYSEVGNIENTQMDTFYFHSCHLGNLSLINNVIRVKLNPINRKCRINRNFETFNMLLIITPVKVTNFSLGIYLGKTYEVVIKKDLNSSSYSKAGFVQMDSDDNDNNNNQMIDSPLIINSENLCNVSNIYPRIIGESSSYTFSINLENELLNADIKSTINEISIFFSDPYFLSFNSSDIIIYFKDSSGNLNLLNHSTNKFEILNIFLDQVDFTSVKVVEIIISGIYNTIYSKTIFPCTVNNFFNNVRKNIITGFGRILNPLKYSTNEIGYNLVINNSDDSGKDYKSRFFNDLHLNFSIDYSLGIYKIPLTIKNSPSIVIFIDKSYFLYINNKKIDVSKVSIKQYLKDENQNIIESSTNPKVKNVEVLNNSITIYFDELEWFFPNNFESLEVVIKDIKNPDYSLNTSPIEIILTNQDNSSIFTTFSNLDNFAFKKYENQNDIKESLLKYYKGRGFSYDTNLSLIQVKDNENPNVYNEISISQGSYKKFVFIKDKILNKGSLENTKISLNSDYPFIKSYDSSYLFEIYSMKSVEFQLATKCNLSNGKYIIKFNSSNPNYPISLVQLNVVRKEKNKIRLYFDSFGKFQVLNKSQVMNESLFYMYAKIENISFDEFDITLKNTNAVEFTKENKKFSKNVNTIILSTKVTSKVTTEGAINLESGNNCYELEPSQLSLNITNSANPIVVKNTLFSPRNFTLIQNNVDDLNSISVNFTTSIFPVNLQCLLYCSNKNSFESENYSFDSPLKAIEESDQLVIYYYKFVNNRENIIKFENLLRGQEYKFSCQINNVGNPQNVFLEEIFPKIKIKENFNDDCITIIDNNELSLYLEKTQKSNNITSNSSSSTNILNSTNSTLINNTQNNSNTSIINSSVSNTNNSSNKLILIDDSYLNMITYDLQTRIDQDFNSDCLIVEGPGKKYSFYTQFKEAQICTTKSSTTSPQINSNLKPTKWEHNGKYYNFCVRRSFSCKYDKTDVEVMKSLNLFTSTSNSTIYNASMFIQDNTNMFIDSLSFSNFKIDNWNKITFDTSFPNLAYCRYSVNQISADNIETDQIDKCNLETANFCGKFETGPFGSKVQIRLTNVRTLNYFLWIYCHSFKETPQFKTKPKNFQRFLANLYVEATDPDKSNSTQVIVNGTTNTNTVNNNSSLNNTGNINNSSNKPIDINPTPIYERILKANILLLLFITLLLF